MNISGLQSEMEGFSLYTLRLFVVSDHVVVLFVSRAFTSKQK